MYKGLKMIGLKKAVGSLYGDNNEGCYTQISYDMDNGEIICDDHVSLGEQEWTQYHDNSIITIGNFTKITMEELKEAIFKAVEDRKAYDKMMAEA